MGQTALAILEVPAVRPPGVTPRQWRHALLLPHAVSGIEACKMAGYAPASAEKAARRLADSLGVRRATEAIQAYHESQRDKASEIKRQSSEKILSRIADDSASDALLVTALKTAHEIEQTAGPKDETAVFPPSWYRDRQRRALLRFGRLMYERAVKGLPMVQIRDGCR